MFPKVNRGSGGGGSDQPRIDTRYYDELFVKIRDEESEEFRDPESLEILYGNILEQIAEDEVEMKKCLTSFHIDFFVYKSDFGHFVQLFDLMTQTPDKINLCLNEQRASRAYDACLLLCGTKIKSAVGSVDYDSNIEKLKAALDRLSEHLIENFDSMLVTQLGVFALRSLLRVIGQPDPLDEQATQNFNAKKANAHKSNEFNIKSLEMKLIPGEWKIRKFIKRIAKNLKDINILEKGLVVSTSPLLSLILRKLAVTYPEQSAEIIDIIHKQFVKKANSFHSMIQDAVGSRFIESFLFACPADLLVDHYFEKLIQPNLVTYVNHNYANYPIQALLKLRIADEPRLSVLFDSLVENLSSVVNLQAEANYKNFLVVEMLNACQKCSDLNSKSLVEALINFFGCNSDENRANFLKVLLIYQKVEEIEKESSVDQALYMFDLKPVASTIATKLIELDEKTAIKSFGNLNSNDLEYLCTNNVGSHFIQQCLKIFDTKDRTVILQAFLDKIKGRFSIICTNKSGSYVAETIWSISNLKQRIAIADELKSAENQLRNDQYARFLVNKIGLSFYKRKTEEWKQIQTNEFKKRKMLSELLDESGAEKSSNKIKKH